MAVRHRGGGDRSREDVGVGRQEARQVSEGLLLVGRESGESQ